MRYWAIRFSDQSLGAPTSRDKAYAAFDRIDSDRRPLCSVVCLEEVADEGYAETLRPPILDLCVCGKPADPRWFLNGKPACDACAPDPFAESAFRQTLETLPEVKR